MFRLNFKYESANTKEEEGKRRFPHVQEDNFISGCRDPKNPHPAHPINPSPTPVGGGGGGGRSLEHLCTSDTGGAQRSGGSNPSFVGPIKADKDRVVVPSTLGSSGGTNAKPILPESTSVCKAPGVSRPTDPDSCG